MDLPRWLAQTLLALGVVAALALPGLTAAYSWRLANGHGVSLESDGVTLQPIENATRLIVTFNAYKADREQDLSFQGGSGTLRVGGLAVPSESVTARSFCEAPECFRNVAFTFLLERPSLLERGWTLQGETLWESEVTELQSPLRLEARGEGTRFD